MSEAFVVAEMNKATVPPRYSAAMYTFIGGPQLLSDADTQGLREAGYRVMQEFEPRSNVTLIMISKIN